MALPPDFWEALALIGRASDRYRVATGCLVVIVGGSAVSFYTQGQVSSGDFDMVCDFGFERELLAEGFVKEDRPGHLLMGYYHPSVPRLGFQMVSGSLFDGRADKDKILPVRLSQGNEVFFPPIEDLIADRLAQYLASNNRDDEMLEQAKILFSLASQCDEAYLLRRIREESGNPNLIGLA